MTDLPLDTFSYMMREFDRRGIGCLPLLLLMQGRGKMGVWEVETPALIRYGQLTNDEFFISEQAAMEGVTITNASTTDPIVMLKHFGPGNPDLVVGGV